MMRWAVVDDEKTQLMPELHKGDQDSKVLARLSVVT
jgi:hypothetical protein